MRTLSVLLLASLTPAQVRVEIDQAKLEGWVDEYLGQFVDRQLAPGIAFSFAAGGRVLFSRGYGHADVGARREVDPATTAFRVASLSKPFVATAVLQLVERGAVGLHADVNGWLRGLAIPDDGLGPVTIHHLLTHTAGFDDRNVGRAVRDLADAPPLADHLRRMMPRRVYPPGTVCAYSNYGFALLGHVVEVASGQPFADYVAEHVFEPLAMRDSSFAPAGALRAELAVGYGRGAGGLEPLDAGWDVGGAAANLTATADDIARFLVAQLEGGVADGRRVLAAESVAAMQARQFAHHPALGACGYGLFERTLCGWRILEHGGHWTGYRSRLVLIPDTRLGFFVSVNGEFAGSAVRAIVDGLLQGLLPDRSPEREAAPIAAGHAHELAGWYRSTALPRSNLERIASLFELVRVEATGDASVRVFGADLVEVEPLVFAVTGGDPWRGVRALAFRRDEAGTFLFETYDAYERVAWYDTVEWQLRFAVAIGALFVLGMLGWAAAAVVERRRGRRLSRAHGLAAALGAINLGWLGALYLTVADALGSNGGEFAFGLPLWAGALLLVPLAVAGATALLAAAAVAAWRRSVLAGCWLSLATAGNAGYLLLLWHWNLLGFHV